MSRYHHHRVKKHRILAVKNSSKYKLVDRATYVVAILEPLITVPQAIAIFTGKSATGVSLTTWVGYEALTVVWVWYALAHKDKLILLYQGLYIIIQTIIIVGCIMYGAKW
jgi:uncharacterized protein with PQ loop repeat